MHYVSLNNFTCLHLSVQLNNVSKYVGQTDNQYKDAQTGFEPQQEQQQQQQQEGSDEEDHVDTESNTSGNCNRYVACYRFYMYL